MKRHGALTVFLLMLMAVSGCASEGRVGILSRGFSLEADAGHLLRNGRTFDELGPVHGEACRHLILLAIPWGGGSFGWGTATLSSALESALSIRGGDALLNVRVTTSLYNCLICLYLYDSRGDRDTVPPSVVRQRGVEAVLNWIVYIIECRDGTLYTGVTNDLTRRLTAHAKGIGAKYTRGRSPFSLRYTETHPTKGQALQRERQIKKLETTCKRALASRPDDQAIRPAETSCSPLNGSPKKLKALSDCSE